VLFFDHLDHYDAAEARVPRLPNFSHPAFADLTGDLIMGERFADHRHSYLRSEIAYMLFGGALRRFVTEPDAKCGLIILGFFSQISFRNFSL
jgi:hypothetical protein